MDALMQGCMDIHQTKIVTTMSCLPASGLDKNDVVVKSMRCTDVNTMSLLHQITTGHMQVSLVTILSLFQGIA